MIIIIAVAAVHVLGQFLNSQKPLKRNVRQVQWRLLPLMGLNLHWVISPSYSSPPYYALEHIPKLGWGGLSWLVACSILGPTLINNFISWGKI